MLFPIKTNVCFHCGNAMMGNEPSSSCWVCHGRALLKLARLRERLLAELEGRDPHGFLCTESRQYCLNGLLGPT
jgi:hypothetical protein